MGCVYPLLVELKYLFITLSHCSSHHLWPIRSILSRSSTYLSRSDHTPCYLIVGCSVVRRLCGNCETTAMLMIFAHVHGWVDLAGSCLLVV